ncbi:MAG: hypothetical protein ACI9E5_000397 [Candidatus Omnitrophota bacterium]|jgi:hypothetical protein
MKWIHVVLIILMVGCAGPMHSYHTVRESFKTVDLSDGVDRGEAVWVSLNTILDKGLGDRLYGLKPLSVKKYYIWDADGEIVELQGPPSAGFKYDVQQKWVVLFKDKENTYFFGLYPVIPFYVELDALTGEVLGWGLKTD